MDEYYAKYAPPLGILKTFVVRENLNIWIDNLREELESLIYIKNGLNRDGLNKIETKVKTKLIDIISKLEKVSIKEIECISDFIHEINCFNGSEIDEKIFTKLEFIRENYNKILLNIQKMAASSPIVLEMREKYEMNKSSLTNIIKKDKTARIFQETINTQQQTVNNTLETEKVKSTGKGWLDKLGEDVDMLKKEQFCPPTKKPAEQKDYTVDKDIDTIVSNFNKCIVDNRYKPAKNISTPARDKKKITQAKTVLNKQISHRSVTPPLKDNRGPTYDSIKNVTEEINQIKNFCKALQSSVQENCIMQNEKRSFDKMKNDHIKLHADVAIIKDDLKEFTTSMQEMTKRIQSLEEENKNLRTHNKNLVNYIQGLDNNKQRDKNIYVNDPYIEEQRHTNQKNFRHESSSPLSDVSAFNSLNNISSVEMMNNVNSNIENNKKRRFLIPRTGNDY